MSSVPPISNIPSTEQQVAQRLEEFRALRARGALCAEVTEQLATEAASAFLSHFRETGEYLRGAITLLGEIATLEEPCLSDPGRRATFPLLVEYLGDSFDPQFCGLYDRAFAQLIASCRRLPSAGDLDRALRRFGLHSEQDLLDRKTRIGQRPPLLDPEEQRGVRKVLIPSRVTLGADVAITSVVLEKVKRVFPQAERVLLGSAKLRELFGGDTTLRIRETPYASDGGLLERLRSWLPLVAAVAEEVQGLRPAEYLMVDPDSRLLQLGLLPALEEESRYFFLESRRYGDGERASLSELALRWLGAQFGGSERILPAVSLNDADRALARAVCRRLREGGAGKKPTAQKTCRGYQLVAVSFGTGGNAQKRLPDPFEELALVELLRQGCTLLFDKGFGAEEIARADGRIAQIKNAGWAVEEWEAGKARSRVGGGNPLSCRVLTWQGRIGTFSALAAESDAYLGYDSAGQHIAAALGVPTLDVFSRNSSEIFRARWRPTGPGFVRTLAESAPDGSPRPVPEIVDEVLALLRQIRTAQWTD